MRSRTLGAERIRVLAPKLGISENILQIHNDQYRDNNFDFVVTSIGNAFYRTNKSTGLYEWQPNSSELNFLHRLLADISEDLEDSEIQKRLTFNKIYIAKSTDLAVNNNGIVCTRKKCPNNINCNFIPNYPVIKFDLDLCKPMKPWYEIEACPILFNNFVNNKI